MKNEPMTRPSEAVLTPGLLATAALAHTAAAPGRLPTQDELPYSDGEPMESEPHVYQIPLLVETLKLHWAERDDFFAGGNMFVYFSEAQVKHNDFRGPDFFVVMGVKNTRPRKSWVRWEEGKVPDLVIEFLSESTAAFDRGEKKRIYQDDMKVQEYFYFDLFSDEFAGFARHAGVYQPLRPDQRGRLSSAVTGLALRRWQGEYLGVTANWLRWETLDGHLLPTNYERAEQADGRAEQERVRAEQERARAEQATERAEQLAARLSELGVDSATLD